MQENRLGPNENFKRFNESVPARRRRKFDLWRPHVMISRRLLALSNDRTSQRKLNAIPPSGREPICGLRVEGVRDRLRGLLLHTQPSHGHDQLAQRLQRCFATFVPSKPHQTRRRTDDRHVSRNGGSSKAHHALTAANTASEKTQEI